MNAIFTLFHEEPSSSLLGLTISSDKSRSKISRVTFYNAFKPILKTFGDRDAEAIFEIVNKYLKSCIRNLKSRGLEKYITNTIVFRGLISFLPTVARRVKDRYSDYHEEAFDEVLTPLFLKIRDSKVKKPGLSYKNLTSYLEESLNTSFTL
jgi:hypothetical protein